MLSKSPELLGLHVLRQLASTCVHLSFHRSQSFRDSTKQARTTWKDVIKHDLASLMTVWTLEETEVAARDRKIWGHFLHQAAGASMHDAIWWWWWWWQNIRFNFGLGCIPPLWLARPCQNVGVPAGTWKFDCPTSIFHPFTHPSVPKFTIFCSNTSTLFVPIPAHAPITAHQCHFQF